MKKNILNGAIVSALLCIAILPFAGCDTGSSVKSSTPGTDTTTTPDTPDTPTTPTTPTSTYKLDFESANIATLITDGFAGEVGDMNKTWGVDGTGGTATSDMSFSADTTLFASGAASLKVTATVLQNTWAHSVAQWSFKTDFSKAGISTPVDLTDKTVSIKAYIPAAGALTSVKLVFIDSMGKKSQGKEVPITAKDTWTDVTYKYVGDIPAAADGGSATSDYTVKGFDITKISAINIVAIKNSASVSSSETLYIDSLNW